MASEKFEKVMLLNHKLLGFGDATEVFNSKALLDAYGGHLHIFKDKNGEIAISDTCCDGEHDA
jgi:manganese/iron transport system ATP-binding protein